MPPTVASKRKRVPSTVLLAILLFALAAGLMLTLLPQHYTNSTKPPLSLFALSGLGMIILTGLLFASLSKLGLGLKPAAIVLAVGYNATIAVIKFSIAPYGLYQANKSHAFDDTFGNANNVGFYLFSAVAVLLLYMLTFWIIYRVYRKRTRLALALPKKVRDRHFTRLSAILILLLFGGLIIGGVGIGLLLLLGVSVTYLGYIFGAIGPVLVIACVVAIILAAKGFEIVQRQAIATRNAGLLASFFWLGLTMILAYHILWVVFMISLVHLWPFNTYSPK